MTARFSYSQDRCADFGNERGRQLRRPARVTRSHLPRRSRILSISLQGMGCICGDLMSTGVLASLLRLVSASSAEDAADRHVRDTASMRM